MPARWEEEYTVRIQLQERVSELQEVRAALPSALTPPLLLGPGASPWPSLSLPSHWQFH